MPQPRQSIVNLDSTPYYHCMSRCVRRAYLCGEDPHTNQSFEHRKAWVEKRLHQLTEVFSMDICSYAIMSNHIHVILKVKTEEISKLSDDEVLITWHKIYKGNILCQKYLQGEMLDELELESIKETVVALRKRMINISWFMRALNEPIARRANQEDSCTGKFWEGRFKSQPLLDEAALLTCMAYVDLNPVRANIAKTLETSEFTSIKYRIAAFMQGKQPAHLMKFKEPQKLPSPDALDFYLKDYLQLVEETGKIIRKDKKGALSSSSLSVLNKLNLQQDSWVKITSEFCDLFKNNPAGNEQSLSSYCKKQKRKRRSGLSTSKTWVKVS